MGSPIDQKVGIICHMTGLPALYSHNNAVKTEPSFKNVVRVQNVPVSSCLEHVCSCFLRPEESYGELELQSTVSCPTRMLDQEFDTQGDQQVLLLDKPLFQSRNSIFIRLINS